MNMLNPRIHKIAPPRLIAWELTRACNLACRHCRAEARPEPFPGELSHEEGRKLLVDIASAWPSLSPIIIMTGGEPLLRPDALDLAAYGVGLGLRVVMSPNGTLVDGAMALKMKKAGLSRASLSLDGEDKASHDEFRGVAGSFEAVMAAAGHLKEVGLPFQLNSTVTPDNYKIIPRLTDLAVKVGAAAHHVFLLVPVGRALNIDGGGVAAQEYEDLLKNLKSREPGLEIEFKATCAPQYNRLALQVPNAATPGRPPGRGCLGGQGFMFISHDGQAQACGYLPLAAGQIRQTPVADIYYQSPLFEALRDKKRYQGKCGQCEYWTVCGGCRARAHSFGNYLGPEPLCPYEPATKGAA